MRFAGLERQGVRQRGKHVIANLKSQKGRRVVVVGASSVSLEISCFLLIQTFFFFYFTRSHEVQTQVTCCWLVGGQKQDGHLRGAASVGFKQ